MLVKFEKKYWGKWIDFVNKCWPDDPRDIEPWDYDFERSNVEGVGYHELKNRVIPVIEGDDIVGYFYRENLLGFDIFYFGNGLKGKAMYCLTCLKEQYPNALMAYSEYYEMGEAQREMGYKFVSQDSKYGGMYSGQVPMTIGDVDAYVQKVDEVVFPALAEEISFSVMTGTELAHFVHKGVMLYNGNFPCWNHKMAGFQYLSFDNMYQTERDIKFLVAHMGNTLVGVIHFGVWYPGSQDISFIDVAVPYRKKGIATKMIQELNKHLYPDMPLHVSQESEMGKACHISDMFKKYITTVPVKSHFEIYGY